MKKLSFFLLVGSFLSISPAISQPNTGGIYSTADDFLFGKLSYAVDCKVKHQGWSSNILLSNKHVIIKQSGRVYKRDIKDVYAIKYCEGKIVRMYKDGCYTLLNPTENIQLYEVTQNPASKGNAATKKYYFSRDARSDVQELSMDNLKAAFTDNRSFLDALNNQVGTDSELLAYDGFYKMYKLNRIYKANSN
jgi:hypothetical protein